MQAVIVAMLGILFFNVEIKFNIAFEKIKASCIFLNQKMQNRKQQYLATYKQNALLNAFQHVYFTPYITDKSLFPRVFWGQCYLC